MWSHLIKNEEKTNVHNMTTKLACATGVLIVQFCSLSRKQGIAAHSVVKTN